MVEMAMNFITEELSKIKNLEENIEVFKRKIEFLTCRKADVLTTLEGAEHVPGKKRKREVENWLECVDQKRRQFERFVQELGQLRSYNILARRCLARRVTREIEEVEDLVDRGKFPEGVVLDVVVKESVPLVMFRAKGLAFEQNLGNILAWLMDDEVLSIGLYGMGGVGKTTLAMHLHDKLLQEPLYSGCVYWITVSQESNNFKLQNDIAKAMNIRISDEDDEGKRAAALFQASSKRERFVLILDDVWKQFNVNKVGFPFQRYGSKVVVTSRFADVCQRIGCQKLMKVEALSEMEAWELFKEEYGQEMLDADLEETAKKFAEKCGGLPLGIITMARSMRGVTDIYAWKDALEELNDSCMAEDNMKTEVLPILLYSFNRLKNEKLKNCFLYCCLYPEDHEIIREDLISMFIVEEVMDRRSSREAEFNQGQAILTELENCCLLVRSGGKRGVKMHDLVREMALWITRERPRFMVKAGLQLNEIPAEMEWRKDLNKISLMQNNIKHIPAGMSPNCPNLSTLSMRGNPLSVIPEAFFVYMSSLEILDLSRTEIVQLPNSILDLRHLKALLLGYCRRLVSLPSLTKLEELRELDLSFTDIKEVIHGMESLVKLKCLNLDSVSLEMIPTGTLRRLSILQRLILATHMAVEVEELEGLRCLEEFQGTFYSIRDLSRFVKSRLFHRGLSFYNIGVGNYVQDFGLRKQATLINCDATEIGRENEIMLPRDMEMLLIESCEDMECIIRLSSEEELMKKREWVPLERVKNLHLYDLPNLTDIIKWEPAVARDPPPGTLSRLKKLEIHNCKSLKKLFPRGLLDSIRNLEELYVHYCEQMEEIIEDEGRYSIVDIALPRLMHLGLHSLTKLKRISASTTICDSIEIIEIKECTKLKKIPLFDQRESAPPALKEIIISNSEKEWWDSLEWDHFDTRDALEPFLNFDD